MMRILSLSIMLIMISVVASSQTTISNKDVLQFLKEFEQAVKQGDENAVLYMMDPIYRREQHDDFLKGDTEQFLQEFFCGSDGAQFQCIKLENVKKLKRKGLEQVSGSEWRVIYEIKSKEKFKVKTEWIIIPHRDGTHDALGLVGAVG